MLVATFAVAYLLQNAALLQYTYRQQGGLGDPVGTLAKLNRAVEIGSLNIRWATFLAIGAALVSLAGLALLLNHTSIGLQMRAAALDFRTSRLLGIKADTVIMAAVAVAGVLAAVVAVILSITSPLINPTTGLNETLIVLVGVVAAASTGSPRRRSAGSRSDSPPPSSARSCRLGHDAVHLQRLHAVRDLPRGDRRAAPQARRASSQGPGQGSVERV